MGALYIMIGASLVVAIGFLAAFIWSVKNDQYDDDYTPSVRILFDEHSKNDQTEVSEINNQTKK